MLTNKEQTNEGLFPIPHERATLNPWCFDYIDFPTNIEELVQDIQAGEVWIISDGSYNPARQFGTAAWLLEGKLSKLQISGTVITPGDATELSAYRCELAGILAAITVINEIALSHDLSASLTLFCDCESGIDKAFFNFKPTLHDASHDLLKAIHYKRSKTRITWTGAHVSGHQDEIMDFEQLDRPSQLNVIVDQMAKDFLSSI
jgi:hypothetical protein